MSETGFRDQILKQKIFLVLLSCKVLGVLCQELEAETKYIFYHVTVIKKLEEI